MSGPWLWLRYGAILIKTLVYLQPLLRISPYSVGMRENMDQNNSNTDSFTQFCIIASSGN